MTTKTEPEPTEGHFVFEVDGQTYTMPNKTVDTLTFGFLRAHKAEGSAEYMINVLEALAGDTTEGKRIIAVLDGLTQPRIRAEITPGLSDHLGVTLGE